MTKVRASNFNLTLFISLLTCVVCYLQYIDAKERKQAALQFHFDAM